MWFYSALFILYLKTEPVIRLLVVVFSEGGERLVGDVGHGGVEDGVERFYGVRSEVVVGVEMVGGCGVGGGLVVDTPFELLVAGVF